MRRRSQEEKRVCLTFILNLRVSGKKKKKKKTRFYMPTNIISLNLILFLRI